MSFLLLCIASNEHWQHCFMFSYCELSQINFPLTLWSLEALMAGQGFDVAEFDCSLGDSSFLTKLAGRARG